MQRSSITRYFALLAATVLAACSGSPIDSPGYFLSDNPLVGKVVWHDLMSDDLEASKEFYGGLLGWTFERTERANGKPYLLARSGGQYVAGILEVRDWATSPLQTWRPRPGRLARPVAPW